MAIVDHSGFPCWSYRHQLAPPPVAVAIVRRTNSPNGPLDLRCQSCVDELATADAHYVVAYLQPTRQRRPQPDTDELVDLIRDGAYDVGYDPSRTIYPSP